MKAQPAVIKFFRILNVNEIRGLYEGAPTRVPFTTILEIMLLTPGQCYCTSSSEFGEARITRKKDSKIFLLEDAYFTHSESVEKRFEDRYHLYYTYHNPVADEVQEEDVMVRDINKIVFR